MCNQKFEELVLFLNIKTIYIRSKIFINEIDNLGIRRILDMSHQTRTIQFDEFIFETIELLYEFAPFKEVFIL